jgi:two-component system sensor histidine kinase AgrC
MNFLNNIWLSITTENEMLTKIIGLPFIFIEVTISMLLFTSILRISASKKQKIIYVLITSLIGIICSTFIPKPYSNIITLIAMPITVMLVFKVGILKALFAEFLPTICIVVSEIIIARIFLLIFSTDYATCSNIPFYRLIINLSIYAFLFGIYKLIQYLKFNINMLDHISIKSKHTLILNAIIAMLVIFIQIYLIVFYNDKLPTFIILINIISLIAYFTISIYSLVKTMKLEKTTADLEQEKLYNKTLQILHDNVRAFKHDFSNIIAGIGGYIATKDMDGLEKYYKQLLQDCNQVNNLSSLSPDSINNPAIYTVLANKYYKADSLGIKINLETFVDFNNLHMGIYEFTRVLGILMDNAIEAASECAKKIINVIIRNDVQCNRQLLIIENTYNNKDVNIDRLSEKGYSTKPNNTGLGLWEVNKIIKRHKNLACFTSKTPEFFKQQFEIYNE